MGAHDPQTVFHLKVDEFTGLAAKKLAEIHGFTSCKVKTSLIIATDGSHAEVTEVTVTFYSGEEEREE